MRTVQNAQIDRSQWKMSGKTDGGACRAAGPAAGRALAVDLSLTRSALGLALGSLILAGGFSLWIVCGRIPGLASAIGDPQFFKRCLVVHVDLALVVWFFSFAAALFSLIPGTRRSHSVFRAGLWTAVAGVCSIVAGAAVPRTEPILSNYVPVIDNSLFVAGLALFFGGLLVSFCDGRLFNRRATTDPSRATADALPGDATIGLKTVAVIYVLAMATFVLSWAETPTSMDAHGYYESVFWGGGHVLQVANACAMVSVWLILLGSLLKRPIISNRVALLLFALLLAPHLIAPLLTWDGTSTLKYRLGFTRLMQFGIFPIVTTFLFISVWRVRQAFRDGTLDRRAWRDPRLVGFAASAALTIAGFALGASIRNSTTMIPAHYHASIGAVTLALMAVSYLLLKPLGLSLPNERCRHLVPWQLGLFGGGQVIFSIGFGLGGMHGLGRKAYGAEQHVTSLGEYIGLGVMGVGGLIAIAGGLMFLVLMIRAWQPRFFNPFTRTAYNRLARSNA